MYSQYDNMTVHELEIEAIVLRSCLANERIWLCGSAGDPEEERNHIQNINMLEDELAYVEEKLKEV